LLGHLPQQVIDSATMAFCLDDNSYIPKEVAELMIKKGFVPINLAYLYNTLDQGRGQIKTYWDGNPQIFVRPDFLKI